MAEFLSARVARLQADLDRAKQELRLQEADLEATQYDGPFWKGQWLFACREAANARARAEEAEVRLRALSPGFYDCWQEAEARAERAERDGEAMRQLSMRRRDDLSEALARAEKAEEVLDDQIKAEEVADAIRACDEIALILKTDLTDLVETLRAALPYVPVAVNVKLRTLLDRMDKGTKGQLTRFDLEKMIEQREGTILKQQEMLLAHPAVEGLRTALNGIPDEKTLKRLQAILKELEPEELRQVRGH